MKPAAQIKAILLFLEQSMEQVISLQALVRQHFALEALHHLPTQVLRLTLLA
jgi:hypothetical protein